jgi:hypothetical protein
MDPFDEFEFKPLTDGLGFHKKSVSLKEGLKNTGVLDEELMTVPDTLPNALLDDEPKKPLKKHTFEDVLSALEKTPLQRKNTDLDFTEPLPREPKKHKKSAMEIDMPRTPVQSPFPRPDAYRGPKPGTPAVKPEVKNVPKKEEFASAGTRRGAADSPVRQLMPATISVPSAFLDFIIVLALAIVFLVALLTVTHVDLNVVIRNLSRDVMTQVALGIMFIAVMQMYVVIARSFFGATLGEWTFDLQVGKDEEQRYESYPLRIALRSFLVTITGLVLLPLISAIARRDIAGHISGVKLYRHR